MNAREYCEMVQQKERLQKRLIPTIPCIDNHSPLVSLKESGFDLIFEPFDAELGRKNPLSRSDQT